MTQNQQQADAGWYEVSSRQRVTSASQANPNETQKTLLRKANNLQDAASKSLEAKNFATSVRQYAEAIRLYREAQVSSNNRNFLKIWERYAESLFMNDEFARAKTEFEYLRRKHESNASKYYLMTHNLAACHLSLGNYKNAEELYEIVRAHYIEHQPAMVLDISNDIQTCRERLSRRPHRPRKLSQTVSATRRPSDDNNGHNRTRDHQRMLAIPLLDMQSAAYNSRDSAPARGPSEPQNSPALSRAASPGRLSPIELHPSISDFISFEDERAGSVMDEWFRGLDDTTHELMGSIPASLRVRTKIGVIDSGLDGEHAFFHLQPRLENLKAYSDFTSPDNCHISESISARILRHTCQDEEGHGTHIISILMTLDPWAKFYVAKVAKSSTPDPSLVSKAIKWLTQEGVDITVMAFGWPRNPVNSSELSGAINSAGQQKIVFGAATNRGSQSSISDFPARLPYVIAVNALNSSGYWSKTLSCRLDTSNGPHLAAPGEYIQAAQSSRNGANGSRRLSGTSQATAIAAGTASLLLMFLRSRDERQNSDLESMIQFVKSSLGMKWLLQNTSSQMPGYFALKPPWDILNICDNGTRRDYQERRAQLIHQICQLRY